MKHADVIGALASRLAVSLSMIDRAVVFAPQEFYPIETTRQALKQVEDPASRTVIEVRTIADVESLEGALRDRARPLLVEWHGLDEQLDELLRAVAQDADRALAPQHSIVVAAAVDSRPVTDPDGLFDVVLGSSSLVIDSETLKELSPERAADGAWSFRVLRVTGGVPALLEAFAADLDAAGGRDLTQQWMRPGARPEPGRSADAAAAWAERAYPGLAAEPLVLLHAWAYFVSEAMMVVISSHILDRRVTAAEVREARLNGAITRPGTGEPGFPVMLAMQLVDRMLTDPIGPVRVWRRRMRTAMADLAMPIPDAVRVCTLTMIRDWSSLDRVLASSMHILATFASNERLGLAEAWGDRVPAMWTHIAYAREFLQGTWRSGPPFLPMPWLELMYLVDGEDEESAYPLIKRLRGQLMLGLSAVRPDSVEDVRRFVLAAENVLTECASKHLDARIRRRHPDARSTDDAAVLALCLMGMADGMIFAALLSDAQACLGMAASICAQNRIGVVCYPALALGMAARNAMLSGKTALHEQARAYIEEYGRLVAVCGARDELPEQLIRIATRYSNDWNANGLSSAEISPNAQFAPLQVEAEGWALLVDRGTLPAYQWLQAFLGRARWSDLQPLEWWPLHATLAMIDAREGRLYEAQRRLEDGLIPSEMALVIRASVELVQGHSETVNTLVDRVLAMSTTTSRWRMIAYGLKLGAAVFGSDPNDMTGMILRLYDWSDVLGAVALLPDVARRPIVDFIGRPYDGLVGLRVDGSTGWPSAGVIRLTPRQTDVLQGLAEGKTLGRIAADLGLGKETIRSTAKQMYKRLGVHDRASAVLMGQALGMI
ncbi:helix-turn-helix transcriptional regulator [uncultured Propionibacterium sp.]|uniref:response regulator transcription factor n=1 Tax=uncultured Propionibacterium sp. TaxID=218066 RepID=UPI00292DD006|nr:helix-turn-helix transcriptional regulator [uncultured Propionibacterium sp.]